MDLDDRIDNMPIEESVEAAAAATLRSYREANGNETERMRPLVSLTAWITEPRRLRLLCDRLAATRRFIDYCYLHNNGFFVLYLVDPNIGLQIRLHIWVPDCPPHHEQPHRHRMGFVSHVLAGQLHSTTYEDTALDCEDAVSYEALVISAPASSDFAHAKTSLEPGPTVGLRALNSVIYKTGETYRFPAAGIHRVDTPSHFAAPIVTLTVWEPPFQPSIAFEPPSSAPRVQQSNVRRLDTAEYDRLMGLVSAAIEEQA